MNNDPSKLDIQKKLPARTRIIRKNEIVRTALENVVYCVFTLFTSFGFIVPNKVYEFEDLVAVAQENSFSLIVDNGLHQAAINEGENLILLMQVNESLSHAVYLTHYNQTPVDDLLEVENLALATPKTIGLRKMEKKEIKKIVVRDAKKAVRTERRRKLPNVINSNNVKQELKAIKKNRFTREHVKEIGVNYFKLSKMLSFLLQPGASSPQLWCDGMSKNVLLHKSQLIVTVTPLVYAPTGGSGSFNFLSLIHAATTNALYFQNVFNFNNATPLTFVIAKLTTVNQTASMYDQVESVLAEQLTIPIKMQSAASISNVFQLPLRTGTCNLQTVSSGPQSFLMQASEVYNSQGAVITQGFGRFGSTSAYSLGISDVIAGTWSGNAVGIPGSVTITAVFLGAGGVVTEIVLINFVLSTSGSFSVPFSYLNNVSGVFQLGLVDIFLTVSGTSGTLTIINSNIEVAIIPAGASSSVDATTVIPFSRYQGVSIPSAQALLGLVKEERPTASSMFFSNTSNQFTVTGVNYVKQIKSGTTPRESDVFGTSSIAKSNGTVSIAFEKGFYSAPYTIAQDIEAKAYQKVDTDWRGQHPYTIMYYTGPTPTASNLTARVEFITMIEYKTTTEQQILPLASKPIDEPLMRAIDEQFNVKDFITENGLHFGMIKSWLSRIGRGAVKAAPFLSSAAQMSGNPYAIAGSTALNAGIQSLKL